MKQPTIRRVRPQVEDLEDRWTPSAHFGEPVAHVHHIQHAHHAHHVLRAADSANDNPGVLPPQSHPHGKTYGEWEAAFTQWAYSMPADANPLTDTAPVSAGQTGHVWFIGGTFAPTINVFPTGTVITGKVTRDVTIPTGTSLFFPLIDVEVSTAEGNGTTEAELRASAKAFADDIIPSSLFAQIDGKSLQNLTAYRTQSPLYQYGPLPANNVIGVPGGTVSPSIVDGYHLMLAPLSAGEHTLHFGGEAVIPQLNLTFIQDITYHITVTGG
jgi:hypothetical protein